MQLFSHEASGSRLQMRSRPPAPLCPNHPTYPAPPCQQEKLTAANECCAAKSYTTAKRSQVTKAPAQLTTETRTSPVPAVSGLRTRALLLSGWAPSLGPGGLPGDRGGSACLKCERGAKSFSWWGGGVKRKMCMDVTTKRWLFCFKHRTPPGSRAKGGKRQALQRNFWDVSWRQG
jgi:hypothetical protein